MMPHLDDFGSWWIHQSVLLNLNNKIHSQLFLHLTWTLKALSSTFLAPLVWKSKRLARLCMRCIFQIRISYPWAHRISPPLIRRASLNAHSFPEGINLGVVIAYWDAWFHMSCLPATKQLFLFLFVYNAGSALFFGLQEIFCWYAPTVLQSVFTRNESLRMS